MAKDRASSSPLTAQDVAILGMGRLGSAVAAAMIAHGANATTWNRTPSTTSTQTPTPLPRDALGQARLIWLAVADAAIQPMAERLAASECLGPGQLVIHSSGRLDAGILAPLRDQGCETGSIHPLQPIAGAQGTAPQTPFCGIFVGVEGTSDGAQQACGRLASALGGRPFSLRGVDRATYHAAAVFAANYTVTLAHIGRQLLQAAHLEEDGLPLLLPLMQANLDNLAQLGLPDALTGPLSRCDQSTIEAHLQALTEPHRSLYKALARATLPIAHQQTQTIPTDQWHQLQQLLDE